MICFQYKSLTWEDIYFFLGLKIVKLTIMYTILYNYFQFTRSSGRLQCMRHLLCMFHFKVEVMQSLLQVLNWISRKICAMIVFTIVQNHSTNLHVFFFFCYIFPVVKRCRFFQHILYFSCLFNRTEYWCLMLITDSDHGS